jgi:hypothetical protein
MQSRFRADAQESPDARQPRASAARHARYHAAPASRAAAEKRLFNERGVTKEAADIAATIADAFFGDWPSVHPLTRRFWDGKMLLRHLQGEVSLEELKRGCLNGFADVDNFIGWCLDIPSIREMVQRLRSTEPSKLFDELRNDAELRIDLAGQILDGLELDPKEREQVLRSLREDLQAATTPDLEKARREELEELFETNREWFTARAVTKERFDSGVTASALGGVPSLDVVLYGVSAHFMKLAKLSVNHPKLKRSDLADLIHCSYVPYSIFFRSGSLCSVWSRPSCVRRFCTFRGPRRRRRPSAYRPNRSQ